MHIPSTVPLSKDNLYNRLGQSEEKGRSPASQSEGPLPESAASRQCWVSKLS